MGVESAVYQIRYRGPVQGADRALTVIGASHLRAMDGGNESAARGEDYFIEVQIRPPEQLASVRLAFCNPPLALSKLRTVLSVLLALGPSTLVDLGADQRFETLDDDSWAALESAYEQRRDEFRRAFGDFTAAIAADDVWNAITAGD